MLLSLSDRRGIVVAASLVTILLLPLGAAAQTGSESPDAGPSTEAAGTGAPGTETGDRCANWHTTPDLGQRQGPLAVRAGSQLSDAAFNVEVEAIPTACTLSSATLAELGDAGAIFKSFGITQVFQAGDRNGDAIALNGNDPAGPAPVGPDLVSIFFGRTPELTRREGIARGIALKKLASVSFGAPPRQWLGKGGAFELTYLRGSVLDTATPHSFEIGFMGEDPDKTVPATLAEIDPLVGVRRLVTFYTTRLAGKQRPFVGVTDFGSTKHGPYGTQFYNAPATAFAVVLGDGVVLGYPAGFDPLGMRPMMFDNNTGTFDIGSAPDGPMAFIPPSGSAPSVFDDLYMVVQHTGSSSIGIKIDDVPYPAFSGPSTGGGSSRRATSGRGRPRRCWTSPLTSAAIPTRSSRCRGPAAGPGSSTRGRSPNNRVSTPTAT